MTRLPASAMASPTSGPGSPFIGRVAELEALRELIDASRLVTLVGPGGCGKTRLGLEVSRRALERNRAQVVIVELAQVADDAQVAPAVLAAVGGRDVLGQAAADRLVDHLAGQPMTLMVDTCEHRLDAVATLVHTLLGQLPDLRILTTSREALGIPDEAVYRVPSLALPGTTADFEVACQADAVQLFLERATRVRPGYPFAEEGTAIVEICCRLDGLPLAIELAAARLNVLSPTRIAVGLDDRFRLLTGGSRASQPRHATLHACVEWSYAMLTSDEQHLLDVLAVFRGSFTIEAAAALADWLDADLVFDVIDRLEQKSLVVAEPNPSDTRFHLLDTIREFAAARLAARGEMEVTRRKHLDHFTRFVADRGGAGGDADSNRHLRALHEDLANVEAALDFAFDLCSESGAQTDNRDAGSEALWAMVGGLTFFWSTTGRFDQARRWFDRCVQHVGVPAHTQMPARWGAAHVALYGGDFEFGLAAATEALELAKRIGDTRHEARALNSLGTVELFSDAVAGVEKEERAIQLAGEGGDEWCLADALQVVGYTHLFRADFEAARVRLDEARPIAERLDHPLLLSWDRIGQALMAVYQGDLTTARGLFDDAQIQTQRTNDPNLSMNLLIARAWHSYLDGTGDEWVDRFEGSLHDCGRIGAGEAAPLMAPHVASMLVGLGHLPRAMAVLDAHLDVIIGFTPAIAPRALHVAAMVALAGGDLELARTHIDAARSSLGVLGTAPQAAALDVLGALVAVRLGDSGLAQAKVVPTLAVLADANAIPVLIDAFDVLTVVLLDKGNAVDAARATGAADRLRQSSGIAWSELAVFTSGARSDLQASSEPNVLAASDEGRIALIGDAIAHANRTRGARRRPSLGWGSLTPTELQVCELAAEGLSNSQIAARLFVSPETVKTHLSHIYTKLDVSNRAALAAAYTGRPPRHRT